MPVRMELSRIIISELNDQQVIYLKEVDGERTFPIVIGMCEATSIDRRVKGHEMPRPPSHALIVNMVEELGAEFQDVLITNCATVRTTRCCGSVTKANWLKSTRGRPMPSPWR